MTEREALKKSCPMSFNRNVESTEQYGTYAIIPPRFCIGSDCMAWRTMDVHVSDRIVQRHGYCGIAGVPE